MVRFLFCVLFLNSYLLGMDGDRRLVRNQRSLKMYQMKTNLHVSDDG